MKTYPNTLKPGRYQDTYNGIKQTQAIEAKRVNELKIELLNLATDLQQIDHDRNTQIAKGLELERKLKILYKKINKNI